MYQMKEQDKTPKKQLNEVEIGNIPEKEFWIMIVKVIQDLRKRIEAKIEKMQEMFNKDLEELKNKHLEELKNKQTEKKNRIQEIRKCCYNWGGGGRMDWEFAKIGRASCRERV